MRRSKEQIEKDRKDSAVSEIKKLVKSYGKQMGEFCVWNRYPICVKDVCVDAAGINKDNFLMFGDFIEGRNIFLKIRHSEDDLSSRWLTEILDDLKKMTRI